MAKFEKKKQKAHRKCFSLFVCVFWFCSFVQISKTLNQPVVAVMAHSLLEFLWC